MAGWIVPLSDVRFTEDEIEVVADVYRRGWLSQGPEVAAFERDLAAFTGSSNAVAASSATAALHLILVASGIGAGDEVIVPSLTFAATAAVVVHTGATPVFADIAGLDQPWLTPATVEPVISPRTRAIIVVSYGGHPGPLRALRELAERRGVLLVEDAAHSLGASVDGRSCGSIGHAGAFSFFANKNLPLGEGGMIVTNDPVLAERARSLRSHGMTSGTWLRHTGERSTYEVSEPGFNYRLDEPRAALGRRLLERLPELTAQRSRIAATYDEQLELLVPLLQADERPAWHIYSRVMPYGVSRDAVRVGIHARGVQTSVHYPPVHRSPAFRQFARAELPTTDEYTTRTLTLPLFAHMSGEQVLTVIDSVKTALAATRSSRGRNAAAIPVNPPGPAA